MPSTRRGAVLSRAELKAAGIAAPEVRDAYLRCRRVSATYGRTYFLATLLLPRAKRPYVHALYAFARVADEIVDDVQTTPDVGDRAIRLAEWRAAFTAAVRGEPTSDPVCRAVADTIDRWEIPLGHFDAFLDSMRMDLTVASYDTFEDLLAYVHGSAAVIGLELLPVLEPVDAGAAEYAARMGVAFQLANFIRDVGEDVRRGRVYLPAEDLDRFGVVRDDLAAPAADERVQRLLSFEVRRARELFDAAAPGIDLLHPSSRDCVRTAFRLYGGILDEVERAGHQVLDRRVAVPVRRRLAVAVPAYVRARRARNGS